MVIQYIQISNKFIYFLGDSPPDLDIMVWPSLNVPMFSPVGIICDADVPTFSSDNPLPPVKITIHIGIYRVKVCQSRAVKRCVYSLRSFFPGIPQRVTCTAENAKGGCHFKSAFINLIRSRSEGGSMECSQGNRGLKWLYLFY